MRYLSEEATKRLAKKVVYLQQLCPNGFRSPKLNGRGRGTLTEILALRLGTIKSLDPGLSFRGRQKRERKKFYLETLKEEGRRRDAYRLLECTSNFAPVAPKDWNRPEQRY